jgi:ketosteroid isomerase-like protein
VDTEISLQARIERLEALEAIRRLKALYCLYCDQGYDADRLAELFCEDAVWDAGAHRGVHQGRAAIRAFFAGISERIPFAAHLVTNSLIDVSGDEATGKWRTIMPCNLASDGQDKGAIQIGEYDERYRRVDGNWLISHLRVRIRRAGLGSVSFRQL